MSSGKNRDEQLVGVADKQKAPLGTGLSFDMETSD